MVADGRPHRSVPLRGLSRQDTSPSNNDLVNATKNTVSYVPGIIGYAAKFKNTPLVTKSAPGIAVDGVTSSAYSVAMWVKIDATPGFVRSWIMYQVDNASPLQSQHWIYRSYGQLQVGPWGANDAYPFVWFAASIQKWFHLATVYDPLIPEKFKCYINGDVVGALTATIKDSATSRLGIGYSYPTDSTPFEGTLDEIHIFNRSLTGEEVRRLYRQFCGGGHFVPLGYANCSGNCSEHVCPAGTTDSDNDSNTECQQCTSAGYYAPEGTTGPCPKCPAGMADHDKNSATSCIQCLEGSYSPNSGMFSECPKCRRGFTDEDGNAKTACSRCPAGHYLPEGSSGPCSKFVCEAGTDDDQTATTPCVPKDV